MGIKLAFNTRKQAREWAKSNGGKVKDCFNKPYLGKRWVVSF